MKILALLFELDTKSMAPQENERFRLNCLNEILSGSFKLLNSARESSQTVGEYRKMVLYLVANQFTSGVPGNQMNRLQS